MFNHWQRELERAQWRGTVDRSLQDMEIQISNVDTALKHLHACVEKKLDPLLRWHYGMIAILTLIPICIPLILWLAGILRIGARP